MAVPEEPPDPEIMTIEIPEIPAIFPPAPVCEVFDDFSETGSVGWQRVNDNVMGGRSQGDLAFANNTMILSGSINLNGGGFTSVRAPLVRQILKPFEAVVITAKSDGRGYDLTFRDQNRRGISHRLGLDLTKSDNWQEVTIKLSGLQPAFFGRAVQADSFDKSEAREIGIILNDGLGGDYRLEVKMIKFCS